MMVSDKRSSVFQRIIENVRRYIRAEKHSAYTLKVSK